MKQTAQAQQQGLSLIELMIAMVVGLVLLAGVIQIFTSSRASYMVSEGLARLQENGRFGVGFLADDLRMAGQTGCTVDSVNSLLAGTVTVPFDLNDPVSGFEFTGTEPGATYAMGSSLDPVTASAGLWSDNTGDPLSEDLRGRVVPGSDVVMVRAAKTIKGVYPAAVTPADGDAITTTSGTGVPRGAIVMVSDCQTGDVFQNTADEDASELTRTADCGGQEPCNIAPDARDFSRTWDLSSQLFSVSSKVYYVGGSDRDDDGNPDPGTTALWVADYSQGTPPRYLQLIEGVENMQVLYGIDNTADDERQVGAYVTAADVSDWRDVVTVRVALLVRTTEEIPTPADSSDYLMLAADDSTASEIRVEPAGDRRMRKVFTTTVTLRNALFKR
jgi:type IV pilus assembly protein PilW